MRIIAASWLLAVIVHSSGIAAQEHDVFLTIERADSLHGPWVPVAADDYMVTGRTADMRMKFMERNFNLWVREFLPDRRSAAYELRRQAGSDMLNATGKISLVQHMLGHSSPQTTARFYAVYDREVDVAAVWATESSAGPAGGPA